MRIWACLLLVGLLSACDIDPPSMPDVSNVRWASWNDAGLGVSFDYPSVLSVDATNTGADVFFRSADGPVMVLRVARADEWRAGSLWFGSEPVGTIELSGVAGKVYRYRHDGVSTIAYVVPYRDASLALEFRSRSLEPDAFRARVLSSLTLGGNGV